MIEKEASRDPTIYETNSQLFTGFYLLPCHLLFISPFYTFILSSLFSSTFSGLCLVCNPKVNEENRKGTDQRLIPSPSCVCWLCLSLSLLSPTISSRTKRGATNPRNKGEGNVYQRKRRPDGGDDKIVNDWLVLSALSQIPEVGLVGSLCSSPSFHSLTDNFRKIRTRRGRYNAKKPGQRSDFSIRFSHSLSIIIPASCLLPAPIASSQGRPQAINELTQGAGRCHLCPSPSLPSVSLRSTSVRQRGKDTEEEGNMTPSNTNRLLVGKVVFGSEIVRS